jgi:DNA-binding CsgD family transcriptional regulator/PAS domain-containing protein
MNDIGVETETVSELIGYIYDAALDSLLWIEVLARIADFVGGHAAGLLSKDSVSKFGNAYYNFGVDPHYMRLYSEIYFKFDPMVTVFFCDVEQVVSISDLVPYDEFCQARFYREWVRPQGWVDAANAVLEKSVTSCAYLSVIRSEEKGMVDDEMRRRMRLIVPHVRRAVLIGKVIDLKTVEAATFAATLDGISASIFLVDANGRIVHANASGHDMLGGGQIVHSAQGALTAADPQAARTLRDVIASASGGDAAVGAGGVAVPLSASSDQCWLAHILPLTSGARQRAGLAYAAVAAVFVRKASLDTPSSMEAIAKLYKLTPSELRVFAAIVDVGGVSAVAEALGISEATVKTHLQHLFEKTGLRRQADLMKLVADHADPLRA